MSTKLGAAIARTAPVASSAPSRFMAALTGKRVLKRITIPALGLEADMQLLGGERLLDIDGEVLRAMERRGIEQNVLTQGKFELETATRVLAEAILEVGDPSTRPLGTVAEWGLLAPETIGELWRQYGDFREENDPSPDGLTSDEIAEIRLAVAQKKSGLLRLCGARRLSAYLLTLADPPASSETPKSPPGDSSSAS